MIDVVVGAVIMVVATTSLLLSIELTEDAFSSAGRYPLNQDEHILLDSLAQSFRANPSVLKDIKVVEGQVIGLPEEYQ